MAVISLGFLASYSTYSNPPQLYRCCATSGYSSSPIVKIALLIRLVEAAVRVYLGVDVVILIAVAPGFTALLIIPDLSIGPWVAPPIAAARGKFLTFALLTA